ncbi:TPA: hypothetical protein ACLAUH_002092, partial [Neisseria meningitidis]
LISSALNRKPRIPARFREKAGVTFPDAKKRRNPRLSEISAFFLLYLFLVQKLTVPHYMCKPSRKCVIPSENLSDGICCLYCRFSSVSGFLFGAEADWQSDCNQRMKASRQKQSYPLHRPDI